MGSVNLGFALALFLTVATRAYTSTYLNEHKDRNEDKSGLVNSEVFAPSSNNDSKSAKSAAIPYPSIPSTNEYSNDSALKSVDPSNQQLTEESTDKARVSYQTYLNNTKNTLIGILQHIRKHYTMSSYISYNTAVPIIRNLTELAVDSFAYLKSNADHPYTTHVNSFI